jgi:hypothetical protein
VNGKSALAETLHSIVVIPATFYCAATIREVVVVALIVAMPPFA